MGRGMMFTDVEKTAEHVLDVMNEVDPAAPAGGPRKPNGGRPAGGPAGLDVGRCGEAATMPVEASSARAVVRNCMLGRVMR